MEEVLEQFASTLSVIHRFMTHHSKVDTTDFPSAPDGSASGGIPGSSSGLRLRRASEHSESEVMVAFINLISIFDYVF